MLSVDEQYLSVSSLDYVSWAFSLLRSRKRNYNTRYSGVWPESASVQWFMYDTTILIVESLCNWVHHLPSASRCTVYLPHCQDAKSGPMQWPRTQQLQIHVSISQHSPTKSPPCTRTRGHQHGRWDVGVMVSQFVLRPQVLLWTAGRPGVRRGGGRSDAGEGATGPGPLNA